MFGFWNKKKYKIEVERVSTYISPSTGIRSGKAVPGGYLPFKKNKKDAGFDLIATEDIELQPGTVLKHPLNIRMKLPKGCYAEIKSKSGLGSKGLLVYAGVIDEEYRGIPHVVATNVLSSPPIPADYDDENPRDPRQIIKIKRGEKIAQMVLYPYSDKYYIEEVDSIDTNTTRGQGGFGSTGK